MKNLREQTDAKIAAGRKANPEFMEGVDAIINKAKEFQQGNNAIKVGEKAPIFELPNPEGKLISLDSLLDKGPLVITFYRGNWCPYCNLQLRALQARLNDIHALGATLVAISPQVPDGSMTKNEINDMGFIVLSDQDAKVASQYGIAWEVPEFLAEHMRVDRELDLEKINNGNGHILPIPATFVLGKDGVVQWNYVNVDYRIRSEPDEVVEALKNLS
ncbi:alkyl hydroperoxide reductase/ Thiol specific antioxidant/ Mal allergen [Cellulophaga algicola DSM 14237]|uniref:thioredoxin-dependent peroxiredoxin n=1 Tax=Cellulophaga algicola (strain DSM 14237 / IC166 / ACAM 630) TaxID=688270 RepID=E6X933_CELAD|nr:peroxiredoxin-like family protein [Cellulophaga algicola]ADV50843.1 alkyl hydroperoxide reductase/ Thiol specific antioxidant/ Mal allergen [Cellulophaga algicola DSM 14237]